MVPPKLPPIAMLSSRKNGWSNTHSPGTSSGVTWWNCTPSRYQVMSSGSHSTVKVWKFSESGWSRVIRLPMDCPPA